MLSHEVMVGDSPTALDSTTHKFGVAGGQSVIVRNVSGVTVYLGGEDVTVEEGTPVDAGEWSPGIDLAAAERLYGVVAVGTAAVRVLEAGV